MYTYTNTSDITDSGRISWETGYAFQESETSYLLAFATHPWDMATRKFFCFKGPTDQDFCSLPFLQAKERRENREGKQRKSCGTEEHHWKGIVAKRAKIEYPWAMSYILLDNGFLSRVSFLLKYLLSSHLPVPLDSYTQWGVLSVALYTDISMTNYTFLSLYFICGDSQHMCTIQLKTFLYVVFSIVN